MGCFNELYNGDCLIEMQNIPDKSIDCIICDLPYGTQKKNGLEWDIAIPFDKLWEQYNRIIKDNGAIVLFGVEPFSSMLRMSNLAMYKYDWVWDKKNGANFAQAPYMPLKNVENICIFSKATIAQNSKNRMIYFPQGVEKCFKMQKGRESNSFRQNRAPQKDFIQDTTNYPKQIIQFTKDSNVVHPTQKPVALLEYLIKTYSNEGDTILDNTMGSGSTGVACVNTNRNFIGIELNKKYFDIANNRINEALNKKESKIKEKENGLF